MEATEAFGGYDLYWQLGQLTRLRVMPSSILAAGRLMARPPEWFRPSTEDGGSARDLVAKDDDAIVGSLFRWVRDTELHTLLPDLNVEPVDGTSRSGGSIFFDGRVSLERLSAQATEVNARLVLPNDFCSRWTSRACARAWKSGCRCWTRSCSLLGCPCRIG